jgi:hypothetical protein
MITSGSLGSGVAAAAGSGGSSHEPLPSVDVQHRPRHRLGAGREQGGARDLGGRLREPLAGATGDHDVRAFGERGLPPPRRRCCGTSWPHR